MQPLGTTVMAWRLARGMTQAALAHAARVPRPNLSAIERGDRDVTLRTLRALAVALDVRPGVLADGEPPHATAPPLTRAAMERVARAAVRGTVTNTPYEQAIAQKLRRATSIRRASAKGRTGGRAQASGDRAYFQLKTALPATTLASLFDRMSRPRFGVASARARTSI
jgi:transcriptional regulator with XRE-family HTH domain